MSIFKKEPNPVGRPSNEEIKKRRNKKIIIGVIAVVGLILIGGGSYLLISGTSLSELMGNSVTKTVRVCPTDKYIWTLQDLKNGKCEVILGARLTCPTGYTLTQGRCEKLKSSTSGIQATYNSTTKTYNCPSNKGDQWTITKYVKSGKTTCIKNVFEVKTPTKSCEEGFTLTEENLCFKSFSPKTLKISSKSYRLTATQIGEIKNNKINYIFSIKSDVINPLASSDLYEFELYEIINGKRIKKLTAPISMATNYEAQRTLAIDFNATKKYVSRLVITDVVTKKKVYMPYSNELIITPNKTS